MLYCKLKSGKAVLLASITHGNQELVRNILVILFSIVLYLSSSFRLSPAPEKSSKFQWTFKLVHLQPEKRTYYFAAYSEKEMTVSNTLYCRF